MSAKGDSRRSSIIVRVGAILRVGSLARKNYVDANARCLMYAQRTYDTTHSNPLTSFINLQDADLWREYSVDGYIVVYSITDRRSFQKACDVIADIRQQARRPSKSLNRPILLAANKSDLERARVVPKEGQRF